MLFFVDETRRIIHMTKLQKNIMDFEDYLRKLNRSDATIRSYTSTVRLFFAQGYKWKFEDACRWKESEMANKKPATVNLRIHALASYGEYLNSEWRLKPIKNQVQQYVEHQLTMADYKRLIDYLYQHENYHWYVIIKLLACTGVRISEGMQITLADIRTGYCDVCGKGTKYRRVWFSSKLRKDILSVYGREGLIIPFTDGLVRKKLQTLAVKCNIGKGVLHPHEFRAFFARRVYDRCKDLKFIQDLLGHADIKTTARYLRKTNKGVSRRISQIVTW